MTPPTGWWVKTWLLNLLEFLTAYAATIFVGVVLAAMVAWAASKARPRPRTDPPPVIEGAERTDD